MMLRDDNARADRHGYQKWRWKRHGRYVEVYVHRLVVEWRIGRPLRSDEVAHHVNHDKTDNRDENLALMTRDEHMALHGHTSKALPSLVCAGCGVSFERGYQRQARNRYRGTKGTYCAYACFRRAHPRKPRPPPRVVPSPEERRAKSVALRKIREARRAAQERAERAARRAIRDAERAAWRAAMPRPARCRATTAKAIPCRAKAVSDGFCRFHGALPADRCTALVTLSGIGRGGDRCLSPATKAVDGRRVCGKHSRGLFRYAAPSAPHATLAPEA